MKNKRSFIENLHYTEGVELKMGSMYFSHYRISLITSKSISLITQGEQDEYCHLISCFMWNGSGTMNKTR